MTSTAVKQLAVFPEHEVVIQERTACADLGIDVRMMVQTDEVSDDYRQGWCEAVLEYERLIRTRLDPAIAVIESHAARTFPKADPAIAMEPIL